MRRGPPPSRACSRNSRRCSILLWVVLAWVPDSVSLAIASDLAQDLLRHRIGILVARGDRRESLIPLRADGQPLEAPLDAILDDRPHLATGAVRSSLTPSTTAVEVRAMFLDSVDEIWDPGADGGHGLKDGYDPISLGAKLLHGPQLGHQAIGAGDVG